MCVWGFGCCGPPPHATIKAYDNTTPWALDWYDLKGENVSRECRVAAWPSATPPIAVVSAGPAISGSGSWHHSTLGVHDTSDGSRHEQSSHGAFSKPQYPASRTAMPTDNSTAVWVALSNFAQTSFSFTAQAFDSSLVQQCSVSSSSATGGGCFPSIGINGTDVIVSGSGTLTFAVRRYNTAGTQVASFGFGSLSLTSGRTLQTAAAYTNGTSVVAWGNEQASGTLYRRYWYITVLLGSFVEFTGVTAAAWASGAVGALMPQYTDFGRSSRLTSTHLFAQHASTSIRYACVSLPGMTELWTMSSSPIDVEVFCAIDASRVYTINKTTNILTARAVASGTVLWTLDLTGTIVSSSDTFGKALSGGYLAIVTPTSPVAIVDPALGTLITSIDVGGYDIVERDNRYIVVGPKRTTAT